jgi:hypothetical protein
MGHKLERSGRRETWLWNCGSPIAVRFLGMGDRKSRNTASRRNALLIAEMVTTREQESRIF